MHRFTSSIFPAIFIVLFCNMIFAGTTGKVVGTIKDKATGNPLIGADVVLEGTGQGSSTDSDGYYAIINVPPGPYTLTVYYVGYAPLSVTNLQVSVDRTTTQHIVMSSAFVEGEQVIIEAERPAIELDRTHSSSVVNSETVDLMPVTEISEVLELQAGVVSSGGELHFRGGRAREVTYVVDGVPVSNSFSQSGGSTVNVETNAIAELEVLSGTFNAEYGSAQSGVVNIVTKKPSSTFSGSVQTYAGEWLSSQNDYFTDVSNFDPMAEQDVQFTLTGPIVDGKLGFFLSGRHNAYESLERYEKRYNIVDGWRIAAYRSWVQNYGDNSQGAIPIPDSLATGDLSNGPLREGSANSMNLKMIYTPHPKMTFTVQGFGSTDKYVGPPDPNGLGGDRFRSYQPDGSGTTNTWEYSGFLKFQHFPSDNFFYNLNFSYQHNDGERYFDKQNRVAILPGQPGISTISAFSSGYSLGTTDGFYAGEDGKGFQDQYLALGNINWQIDKHNFIKAGFEVKKHFINVYGRGFQTSPEWQNNSFPVDPSFFGPGNLSYEEYWSALLGYWETWEDSFGVPRFTQAADSEVTLFRDFDIEPLEVAFYVQDKVELGDIIINAGMRLDYFDPLESVPINNRTESFNLGDDRNLKAVEPKIQLSPRVGISFPISSNGAFHASYGHFFQMPSFQRMFNEPLNVLTPIQLDGRRLGNADLEAEKTIAYEIGLQQAVTSDLAVDITAYYKDFENLLGIEQLTTLDRVVYTRYVNRDYGNTRGITLGFTKRGARINGGANYSIAFANGSSSSPDALELITTSTQIGGESGVFAERKILSLDWDQRHAAKVYINFAQPKNWSIGLVSYYETGVPFSPEFVGRFDINEREYRNSEFRPTRWSTDLKAKKHFSLLGQATILFLKVDNLFDHLNHDEVFASTGRGDQFAILPEEKQVFEELLLLEGLFTADEFLRQPDNFSPPRKIELGLELKF